MIINFLLFLNNNKNQDLIYYNWVIFKTKIKILFIIIG